MTLIQRLPPTILGGDLIGFGIPSWEQGVFLNGRFLQYSRDRIMRTLVDRFFPKPLAEKVISKLSHDDVLFFGYDRQAEPLSDQEIDEIHLNVEVFKQRLSIFKECNTSSWGVQI